MAGPPCTSSSRTATPSSSTCRCRSSPPACSPTPSPSTPSDDRGELLALAADGQPGARRHRRQRLRLAAAGHAPGRPDGRPALPAGARPLRAAKRRAPRGRPGRCRGHALRQRAHRHERRLRDDVHRRRRAPLRARSTWARGGPGRPWPLLLGAGPGPGPRAGLEVGGALRHRWPRPARPLPLRPRPRPGAAGHGRPHGRPGCHGRAPGPRRGPGIATGLFLLLMLGLTGLLAAAMVRRPLPVTRGEAGLAIAGAASWSGVAVLLVGLAASSGSPPARSTWDRRARGHRRRSRLLAPWPPWPGRPGIARWRSAPPCGLAAAAGPVDPWPRASPSRPGTRRGAWLQPGRLAGLPWLFTLACLTLAAGGRLHRLVRALDRAGQRVGPAAHRQPALPARRAATRARRWPT